MLGVEYSERLGFDDREPAFFSRTVRKSCLTCIHWAGTQAIAGTLDGIIDTISANHPLPDYLALLGLDGKLIIVGVPPEPLPLPTSALIFGCAHPSPSLLTGCVLEMKRSSNLAHC